MKLFQFLRSLTTLIDKVCPIWTVNMIYTDTYSHAADKIGDQWGLGSEEFKNIMKGRITGYWTFINKK